MKFEEFPLFQDIQSKDQNTDLSWDSIINTQVSTNSSPQPQIDLEPEHIFSKIGREFDVISCGLAQGVNAGCNELREHPWESAAKFATAAASGVVFAKFAGPTELSQLLTKSIAVGAITESVANGLAQEDTQKHLRNLNDALRSTWNDRTGTRDAVTKVAESAGKWTFDAAELSLAAALAGGASKPSVTREIKTANDMTGFLAKHIDENTYFRQCGDKATLYTANNHKFQWSGADTPSLETYKVPEGTLHRIGDTEIIVGPKYTKVAHPEGTITSFSQSKLNVSEMRDNKGLYRERSFSMPDGYRINELADGRLHIFKHGERIIALDKNLEAHPFSEKSSVWNLPSKPVRKLTEMPVINSNEQGISIKFGNGSHFQNNSNGVYLYDGKWTHKI